MDIRRKSLDMMLRQSEHNLEALFRSIWKHDLKQESEKLFPTRNKMQD